MKLAFFGYAWNQKLQPDAYMTETIDSLARTGASVDVYLGNQFSSEYGIYGLKDGVSLDTLQRFIASQDYDAAISFNNSMLIPQVMAGLRGRVVTVIVDAPEHLFDYSRAGPWEVFGWDIEIFAMSSGLERQLREQVADVDRRLHFALPATRIDLDARGMAASRPISWVASYVGDTNLDLYFKLAIEAPDYHALTVKCLELIERDGDLRSIKAENGFDAALIANLPWTFDYFQGQMQNILTNRNRVAVVERLAPHGLALFGNANWQKLLSHNAAVLKALQPGPPPVTHAELRRIYNASKVSINLPQAHVVSDAVQYRVIDVMASNALMITKHSPTSDLYRVFGADCPIPTYRDLDELEWLCAHFLANEPERRALVERCNALVATGFSFDERAADYLKAAGLAPTAAQAPGGVRRIDLNRFST